MNWAGRLVVSLPALWRITALALAAVVRPGAGARRHAAVRLLGAGALVCGLCSGAAAQTTPLISMSTSVAAACTGDCDSSDEVTVDELVKGVNIALGLLPFGQCPVFDCNGDGRVTVDCLVNAVNAAINGCGGLATPTPTPAPGCVADEECPASYPHCGPDGNCWTQPCSDVCSDGMSCCGGSYPHCGPDGNCWTQPCATLCGTTCCGPTQQCQANETCSSPQGTPTPTPQPSVTAGITPGADVVAGPGGTSVTLPPGARTTGSMPSLVSADGSGLAAAGETLVSSVIAITVTGTEPTVGDGTFAVTIPVTGTVGDPDQLLLNVMLADGTAYPVAGVYDAVRGTFTAELMALWNGWKMAVVSNPDLTTILPAAPPGGSAAGWETPDDWKTCAFIIKNKVDQANPVPDIFVKTTLPNAMKKVCDELRTAEFRSPKLWIDSRLQPSARVVHLVRGVQQKNGPPVVSTHFTDSGQDSLPGFTLSGLTEDQMLALGQMFVNYDELQMLAAQYGVTLENVAIHELFHAVQFGYDFRWRVDNTGSSTKAYTDGTATVAGHTFQGNHSIVGADVYLRPWKKPQPLDEPLDDFTDFVYYQRQDYFAYVAKRFAGGSLTSLRWLFQGMSDQTAGKFGLSHEQYLVLYRRAMDIWLSQAWGKGLSEVYADFVLDRAYRHPAYARLRPSEMALPVNSFDRQVFTNDMNWDPLADPTGYLPDLPPLTTSSLSITIPDTARASGALTLTVAVNGVALAPDGVRITVFREQGGAMVASQGEIAVTDVSTPVTIPVGPDVDGLRVFVSNCTLDDGSAEVSFTAVSVTPDLTLLHQLNRVSFAAKPVPPVGGNINMSNDETRYSSPSLIWNGLGFSASGSLGFTEGGAVWVDTCSVTISISGQIDVKGQRDFSKAVIGVTGAEDITCARKLSDGHDYGSYTSAKRLQLVNLPVDQNATDLPRRYLEAQSSHSLPAEAQQYAPTATQTVTYNNWGYPPRSYTEFYTIDWTDPDAYVSFSLFRE